MRIERIELPASGYGTKVATLTAYVQDNLKDQAQRRRPAVVVCPGGCYELCSDRESEPIALALVARGLQAFVLDYAVLEPGTAAPLLPAPQIDLAHAVATVRAHADAWHVDEGSVGLLGCSAGAHLSATYVALMRDEAFLARSGVAAGEARADWQVLCYPAIDLDLGWLSDPSDVDRLCPEDSPLRRAQDLVSAATPPPLAHRPGRHGPGAQLLPLRGRARRARRGPRVPRLPCRAPRSLAGDARERTLSRRRGPARGPLARPRGRVAEGYASRLYADVSLGLI